MKTIKYFLFFAFAVQTLHAQSNIVIGAGSTIDVGFGSDVCAGTYGNISGNLIGDGTQCFEAVPKVLNLVALIEGFYDGVAMVSDTVIVQMRNTVSPYTVADQKQVVLNTSGAGTGSLTNVTNGTAYYIVVQHRNSIETWSGTGKSFSSNLLNYNFTTASSQAYGDNMIQIGSKWCLYSGDVSDGYIAGNQDGYIDIFDDFEVYNDSYAGSYRILTDLNLDGYVDIFDDSIVYNNSYNGVTAKYPGFPFVLKKEVKKKPKIELN